VEEASAAAGLAEADRLRSALLSAVSHGLRTPLASAKAAVSSMRSDDVVFAEPDRDELLATAHGSLERLQRLVENLLDMSRLQAGHLGPHPQAVSIADTVNKALDDLGPLALPIRVRLSDDSTEIFADPGLVERILVNVVSNALRYSPDERPPTV